MIASLQHSCKDWLQSVGALRKTLDNEVFTITVDDKTRQKICLRIDSAADVWVNAKSRTELISVAKTLLEERVVNYQVSSCKEAKRNLRMCAVESFPNESIVLVSNGGNRASGHILHVKNITSVNPQMAIADSGCATFSDTHLTFFQYWSHRNLHAHF
jgi:hypothetical protein